MRILVSEKLSENRFKTPEGYLICTNAILARTGKQTYLRREVFGDGCNDADKEVEVDRTAEEVFAPETLASFENKPLCVEHPDEDVNADNHNLLSVGYVRDVKKDVVDGNEVMTATLVITDKYGIDEVESGRKTDLSCGYDCDIIDDEHPQQRHIRGNHVAICERGRAGIARIVDSIKDAQHQFEICYINYDKYCVVIEANSTDDAIAKFRRKYGMYHIVHVKQIDSIKNMEDSMKKYAEDKHGRTFTLEEIEGGKVKATNMGGREKIFSGWKEAEEEFRKRGITILDSFYNIVEDSVKDAKYVIMHPRKNLYLTVGAKTWSDESDPMIKKFDSEKEAEEYAKKNTSDFKIVLFDSVKDEQLYAVEFSYDGDSWSDYLGHVNVRAKSEQDALTKAKQWAVKHYDNPGFFKISSTKYTNVETIDSVKDMKVSHDNIREQPVYVMQSDVDKNLFFYIGKTHAMKEGEFTYAQYDMEGMTPDELRKDLEAHGWHKVARGPAPFIDEAPHEDRLWKVYLTGGIDANNIMYVKADNEAMARKIAERNTKEEIIKITEYGDTPLTKIDKKKILRNPNRYFDSEKKIEKIARIVSKLK